MHHPHNTTTQFWLTRHNTKEQEQEQQQQQQQQQPLHSSIYQSISQPQRLKHLPQGMTRTEEY